jgi:hypothetical protein
MEEAKQWLERLAELDMSELGYVLLDSKDKEWGSRRPIVSGNQDDPGWRVIGPRMIQSSSG